MPITRETVAERVKNLGETLKNLSLQIQSTTNVDAISLDDEVDILERAVETFETTFEDNKAENEEEEEEEEEDEDPEEDEEDNLP